MMNGINPKADFYFTRDQKWHQEIALLRAIPLDCQLTEEIKWGVPCYTLTTAGKKKSNIVLIHVFKEYCALLFFKGVLLHDTEGILVQQTKNVQSARQIRFTNTRQIIKMKSILKSYIYEAIEVEKAGLKVDFKETAEFTIPEEFKIKLDKYPSLKKAFEKLTPGRQRAYIFYFSQPKQAKTRASRVEKSMPQIMDGKGLND